MAKASFWSAACGMVFACASALVATSAGAAEGADVVRVDNGENRLTLDGQPALALRAWRENYNAHGFDVVTFYVRAKDTGRASLQLVPLFQADSKERYELTASGGADCQLSDFRLVQDSGKRSTRLIVAERDLGPSFADPATVHFTYYELARNADGTPGRPPLYFKAGSKVDSKQTYCDVNDAFDKELHLGRSSGNGGHDRG